MKHTSSQRNGCGNWLKRVFLFMIGLSIAFYILTNYLPKQELQANRAKWHAHGSSTYYYVMQFGFFTQIIDVRDQVASTASTMSAHYPDLFSGETIDTLFDQLSNCVSLLLFGCTAKYDETFGYPTYIDLGCIDACGLTQASIIVFFNQTVEQF